MKHKLISLIIGLIFLSTASSVLAVACTNNTQCTTAGQICDNVTGGALAGTCVPASATVWITGIIERFISIVLWPVFIGSILIMLLVAGIVFVTASGDPSKITMAKNMVMYVIIGIIVGILAYSVYGFISRIIF